MSAPALSFSGEARSYRLPAEWRGERLITKLLLGVSVAVLFILFLLPPIMMALAGLQLGMVDAGQPQEIRPPPLEEFQIARMVDDAGEIGIRVIDARQKPVAKIRQRAGKAGGERPCAGDRSPRAAR